MLEIQQRILTFLVDCCKAILHDLSDQGTLTHHRYPVLPAFPTIMIGPTEYPSTTMMATEMQYRVPAKIDFQRLRALVAAKKSHAEDHIWMLREDPGYFASVMGDWSEHRRERIIDTTGQAHSVGTGASQNSALFWERVIPRAIDDAYGQMIEWDALYDQLELLERLKKLNPGLIPPHNK